MLDGENRGHQGSTSSRLPIRAPGRGVCGKQQSELDLACKERRLELRREHSLTGKRWPQPPAWLATGREDGARESSPLTAREQRTTEQTWALATPAAGVLPEGRRGTPIPHLGSAARGIELLGGGGRERK